MAPMAPQGAMAPPNMMPGQPATDAEKFFFDAQKLLPAVQERN